MDSVRYSANPSTVSARAAVLFGEHVSTRARRKQPDDLVLRKPRLFTACWVMPNASAYPRTRTSIEWGVCA